jgi:TatA/E family protein of Tat protein translocase
MGSLGMQELIIIFVLALIVFGPRKLPELGKTIGKGLAEFKRASNELKQTWEDEVRLDKEKEEVNQILKDSTIKTSEIVEDIKTSVNETVSETVNETVNAPDSNSVEPEENK